MGRAQVEREDVYKRQFMEPVFRAVTNSRGVTLALDVPSGVNCDTGAVEGPCVMADYTVSFSTLKNGHLLQPAKGCCGQVVVVPIGIDLSLINAQESPLEVTDTELAQRVIKPRNPESNKGDYGRLLCLCGSEGMAGAASLCARAALRGGAGLVNVVLPRSIYPIVAAGAQEAIYTLLDYAPSGSLTGEAQTCLLYTSCAWRRWLCRRSWKGCHRTWRRSQRLPCTVPPRSRSFH